MPRASVDVAGRQPLQQRLRLLQIARIEALGEPAVDRSEKFASSLPFSLITPEPRHARGCAKFPGLSLLLTCNRERLLEECLGSGLISVGRRQSQLAFNSIEFSLTPTFFRALHHSERVVDRVESVVVPP